MSAKHTAGPWEVDMYGDVIANGEDVARIAGFYGSAENEANARLIAASPDLFHAAKVALANLLRNLASEEVTGQPFMGDDEHEAIRVLSAAIAKATGETE